LNVTRIKSDWHKMFYMCDEGHRVYYVVGLFSIRIFFGREKASLRVTYDSG